MTEIFNLCYKSHLGGIRDILDLSINDRTIMLDIAVRTRNEEKAEEDNRAKI